MISFLSFGPAPRFRAASAAGSRRDICGTAPLAARTTVAEGIQRYTDEVEYILESGFSLDGTTSGATTFKIGCEAVAIFCTSTYL